MLVARFPSVLTFLLERLIVVAAGMYFSLIYAGNWTRVNILDLVGELMEVAGLLPQEEEA
jgi:hypothetical protein